MSILSALRKAVIHHLRRVTGSEHKSEFKTTLAAHSKMNILQSSPCCSSFRAICKTSVRPVLATSIRINNAQ